MQVMSDEAIDNTNELAARGSPDYGGAQKLAEPLVAPDGTLIALCFILVLHMLDVCLGLALFFRFRCGFP